MTTLREAALDAERRGYSVIPINPRSKHPAVKWKLWQTERADATQIRAWWGEDPTRNLAIATGPVSGLTVLDLDPRNDPSGLTGSWLETILPAPHVQTGGGGSHWYCQDAGLPSATSVAAGFDVRGTGGIVMLPPSVHPSGVVYTWLRDPADLVSVPAEVRAMVAAARQRPVTERRQLNDAGTGLTLAGVLALVESARPYQNGWMAQCPAHDDHTPSLSVAESESGRLLVKCFAGCRFDQVMAALWTRRRDRQLAGAGQ